MARPLASGGCQAFSDDFHGLLIGLLLHAVTDLSEHCHGLGMQQTDLLAMLCHMQRETFSLLLPDKQPANTARHKYLKPNDPRNAAAHSPSSVRQRQAEHDSAPAVRLQPDPTTRSGQVGGPTVCGAPPPSPSSTVSDEMSAENENDAETTLDGDSLMTNMRHRVIVPVTPGPASGEHVRSLLTPPAEKSPRDQIR